MIVFSPYDSNRAYKCLFGFMWITMYRIGVELINDYPMLMLEISCRYLDHNRLKTKLKLFIN